MDNHSDAVLGVDIGGSHISAALIKKSDHAVIPGSELRVRVAAQGPADEILDTWADTIRQVWQQQGSAPTPVGIAMPGPFDYEQGIALMIGTEKYEALYQQDVAAPLAQRLQVPRSHIRFRNDAEAFLLGEMMGGAGIGYDNAIGITLGTGLGSTVHKKGRTFDANRFNRPMYDSFAEEYISTRFFVRRYKALTDTTVKDARALAERIDSDAAARQVYDEFGRNLALFLKDFIRDEQPDLVILGGNIANAWPIFYPTLSTMLEEELHAVTIKKAVLGETAALVGAACIWQ